MERERQLIAAVNTVLDRWTDTANPNNAAWNAIDDMLSAFATGTIPGALRDVERAVSAIDEYVTATTNGFKRFDANRMERLLVALQTAVDRVSIRDEDDDATETYYRLDDEECKPCPETWEELFDLRPIISFEQLCKMKCCTIEEVHRQARIHNAAEHLPPGEREAALAKQREAEVNRLKTELAKKHAASRA